jgi:hypothetical protein
MKCLSADEFRDTFYQCGYLRRDLVNCWDLLFQISCIAVGVGRPKEKIFRDGFSFTLKQYVDNNGNVRSSAFWPTIKIKSIGEGQVMSRWSGESRLKRGKDKEGEKGGKQRGPKPPPPIYGLLDGPTLAFALTGEHHSLASACEAFDVRYDGDASVTGGQLIEEPITEQILDRLVDDVRAAPELTRKMLDEFERHAITLEATKAFSPSSLVKAYMREMGIPPIRERQLDFPCCIVAIHNRRFMVAVLGCGSGISMCHVSISTFGQTTLPSRL